MRWTIDVFLYLKSCSLALTPHSLIYQFKMQSYVNYVLVTRILPTRDIDPVLVMNIENTHRNIFH